MTDDLKFVPSEPLTLGVEVEVQLLDAKTFDLKPMSPTILARHRELGSKLKAELFQSMLEFNTGICNNAHEVEADLSATSRVLQKTCTELGLRMATNGTHPFAHYAQRKLYPANRYLELIDRNKWIARRLMIYGLHVHIGMRDGEHAIQMNNALLHYLPLLLALSASSPFWNGEDTELASSRITFFEATPTGGHPCILNSWAEFEQLYANLLRSDAIRSPKDLWWDIRPSPSFGTLEIRICDGLPTLAETVAITALIHSLATYIDRQLQTGRRFAPPPDWVMRENKWRASRYGIEASLITSSNGDTATLRDQMEGLFNELATIVSDYDYRKQFALIRELLEKGPSYVRQREIAQASGRNLKDVTRFLADEFDAGQPIWLAHAAERKGRTRL